MCGRITRVNGALVEVEGLNDLAMSEVVSVGHAGLPGEVVSLNRGTASIQVYEYTGGLAAGDPVEASGAPLSARLGPGLLGGVFDGLLRRLVDAPLWLTPIASRAETTRTWFVQPRVEPGAHIGPGTVMATIAGDEGGLEHRVLAPPWVEGPVQWISAPRLLGLSDRVAVVAGAEVTLAERWPVRRARPVREHTGEVEPLLTGQRVIDAVFPIAHGGSAAVPGGFGTGKTMLLQQIAKWCSADVIVYVGCGERGNEMADTLSELGSLVDPRTGRPLRERTVIIANTSNMPMMAREVSIFSGITVAEYFRDMGYHAVVIADSTSRWAEALREFASRTGALPAEEGYPASLPSQLASFYERAGHVVTLGGVAGSVTVIGAVSPPGGDTTEPVTTFTQRFVRGLWSLDRNLAYARHYPAVAWSGSYSRDAERIANWYARHGDPEWARRRGRVTALLAEADRLSDLAELVGSSSLPGHERVVLLGGRLLREGVLQQSALSANDSHSTPEKTAALVDAVLGVVDACERLIDRGVTASEIEEVDFSGLVRAAQECPPDDVAPVLRRRDEQLQTLEALS